MFLIVLDVLLLWVEDVELKILMGTKIPLIKCEYIDYQKDLQEIEHWFRIIPDTANTMVYHANDTGQKVLKSD